MSDEQRRTPTEAMRLRPAARPGAPAEVARQRAAGSFDALEARLTELVDAVLELHRPALVSDPPFCVECLLPHPCPTVRLAQADPATPAPPREGSQ